MNDNKLVSVLLAVYNGSQYIEKTVNSVLSQTYHNFELIIVNDGSNDETRKILKQYDYENVVIAHNDNNIGQTKSLNKAFKKSQGEFIARIDCGDWMEPDRLKLQVGYLDKNLSVDILGTDCQIHNLDSHSVSYISRPEKYQDIKTYSIFRTPVLHVSVLMRSSVFESLGGYNEKFYIAADFDLWSRAIHSGYKISNLQKVLTHYIAYHGSFASSNHEVSRIEKSLIIQSNLNKYIAKVPLDKVDKIVSYLYGLSLNNLKGVVSYYNYAIKIYIVERRCFYYLFIYQPVRPYLSLLKKYIVKFKLIFL